MKHNCDRTSLLYSYMAAVSIVYVIVVVNMRIGVIPSYPHDDGLFMELGKSLAQGNWLGVFNQFTLMKGPGYPMFLALSHWLGTSVSLAHALFHCVAIIVFVLLCHKFIQESWLSAALLTLLMWEPLSYAGGMSRILRDQIYYGQALLLLGIAGYTLLHPTTRRPWLWAVASGLLLGWLWLTREEGVWLMPGLFVLIAGAGFQAMRSRRLRDLAVKLALIAAVFAGVQVTFRLINLYAYGSFVAVDVKESNFEAAMRAIQSVRSGGWRTFVPITRDARDAVYKVSPAFASLKDYFEGAAGEDWRRITCVAVPSRCGEIGAGWFMWALRDAAQRGGHYDSPSKASNFYAMVAREISAACDRHELECKPQMLALMPPATWEQLARFPSRLLQAIGVVVSHRGLPIEAQRSNGDRLMSDLHFLNYPLHTQPENYLARNTYIVRGWYYKRGSDWLSFEAKETDGSAVTLQIQRQGSPDIANAFQDALADRQRFYIRALCGDGCVLRLVPQEGESVERKFAELHQGQFQLGGGTFNIDVISKQWDVTYAGAIRTDFSLSARKFILWRFDGLYIPTLVFGFAAFIICTVLSRGRAVQDGCYILAAAAWALALSRVGLLTLIDVTAGPILFPVYLAPVYFMLIAASCLSLAALIQLYRQRAGPGNLHRTIRGVSA